MIKKRDFFLFGNYVGRLIGVGAGGSGFLTVSWLHIPKGALPLRLPIQAREQMEPIPKDVAYNLVEVLKRNERSE